MSRAAPLFARIAAACLAVVGPLAAMSMGHFCDMACRANPAAANCCQTKPKVADDADSHCPLCHEAEREQEQRVPCRCHPNSRHDEAATSPPCTSIDVRAIDQVVVATVHDTPSRLTAELIRRMIDESREIPYRPSRIVFGVWRN
jgi:hypothetical protein